MTRPIISGETSPDDILISGMYDVGSSSTMPFPFGGLLVFNTHTLVFQIAIEMGGKKYIYSHSLEQWFMEFLGEIFYYNLIKLVHVGGI